MVTWIHSRRSVACFSYSSINSEFSLMRSITFEIGNSVRRSAVSNCIGNWWFCCLQMMICHLNWFMLIFPKWTKLFQFFLDWSCMTTTAIYQIPRSQLSKEFLTNWYTSTQLATKFFLIFQAARQRSTRLHWTLHCYTSALYLANSATTDFNCLHLCKVMIISCHICDDWLLIRKVHIDI